MKNSKPLLLFLFLPFLVFTAVGQTGKKVSSKSVINPTGFYQLKGIKKADETYGYFGTVKVKLIPDSKIVINFYICKGYKSYNSGSFYDTLNYKNNYAEYRKAEFDPSCRITLRFTSKGLLVDEQTDDYNSGCGFGHAVVVTKEFFRLKSKKIPTKKELAEE